jgi:hypothetical protein
LAGKACRKLHGQPLIKNLARFSNWLFRLDGRYLRIACKMSATASASNLNAKLAQTVVAASSWASALIAGDDDKWSVIDQSSPGVRRFSVAGLKGEVLVTQPVDPATGERLPRKAAAEAVALTMLRESANACTGVLPFEFVAEHVRRTIAATFAAGTACFAPHCH